MKRCSNSSLNDYLQPMKKTRPLHQLTHANWESSLSVDIQPFDWKTDTLENVQRKSDPLVVRCWGKDSTGKVHLLLFRGFPCVVYMELPCKAGDGRALTWNFTQLDPLNLFLKEDSSLNNCRPYLFDHVLKRKLYFADTPPVKCIRLRFRSEMEVNKFCKVIRNGVTLEHMGKVSLILHEDNVKVLTKFLTRIKAKCTQWIRVSVCEVPAEERVTDPSQVAEYEADFESVVPLDLDLILPHTMISFDLEVYSSYENRFPQATNRGDEIFAISVVKETVYPDREGGERKRWCLCLYDADSMSPGEAGDVDLYSAADGFAYSVIKCKDEKTLIETFARLVRTEDPDLIVGHNVWGFDMKYLYIRALLVHKIKLPNMGRTTAKCTELSSTKDAVSHWNNPHSEQFIAKYLEEEVDQNSQLVKYGDTSVDSQLYGVEPAASNRKPSNMKLCSVNGELTMVSDPEVQRRAPAGNLHPPSNTSVGIYRRRRSSEIACTCTTRYTRLY